MRLALNCPTSMLESVQPFGDIDWINAHRFLNDEAYAEYYRNTGNAYKIIDPGTCESGEPNVTVGDLKGIKEELKVGAVIAPDHPNDMRATIESYNECLNDKIESRDLIAVLQGSNTEELLDLIDIYSMGQSMIAIPYGLLSTDSQGRRMTTDTMGLIRVSLVLSIPVERSIHLLGFVSVEEFKYYRSRPNVMSMNTGVPILQGIKGEDILPDAFREKKLSTLNQLEEMKVDTENFGKVARNIALLRKYMALVG